MGRIIDRRRVMGSQDVLPEGVVPIEYLESNGVDSQYITTTIKVQSGLDVYCKFSIIDYSNYGYVFGDQFGGVNFILRQNGQTGQLQCYLQDSMELTPQQPLMRISEAYFHFWDGNQSASIDGFVYLQRNQTITKTGGFIKLWYQKTGNFFVSKTRMYGFKILLDNNMVLNLIPVRKGQVGFMYDKISGYFFGNAGTGEFILGPDKVGG